MCASRGYCGRGIVLTTLTGNALVGGRRPVVIVRNGHLRMGSARWKLFVPRSWPGAVFELARKTTQTTTFGTKMRIFFVCGSRTGCFYLVPNSWPGWSLWTHALYRTVRTQQKEGHRVRSHNVVACCTSSVLPFISGSIVVCVFHGIYLPAPFRMGHSNTVVVYSVVTLLYILLDR